MNDPQVTPMSTTVPVPPVVTTRQPRTADFFTAMQSAADNPGEVWSSEFDDETVAFQVFVGGYVVPGTEAEPFILETWCLAATWTCDGSEP